MTPHTKRRLTPDIVRIWRMDERPPSDVGEEQVRYTNAKVVLVGESQVGKSGLARRIAHDLWEPTESTVGAWASHLKVSSSSAAEGAESVEHEIWLWDFGGQADQRLVHQLYMGDTALAVLVFDGQMDDVIPRLWEWNRALESAGGSPRKILAAGRTDTNPVRLSKVQLDEFRKAAGFAAYLETSAKTRAGCAELREAIEASIDWARIPWRTSPAVFKRLRTAILDLKPNRSAAPSCGGTQRTSRPRPAGRSACA